MSLINREDLIAEYDRVHVGAPGGARKLMVDAPEVVPEIIQCKACKHNPNDEWFGCPMSHLNEKQRPETAWCWKGERRTDESD